MKIGVHLTTMENEEEEYIVNFNTLIEVCNKYNLHISNKHYLEEDQNKEGYFKDIKFIRKYDLGKDKDYSYLHRYIILQKNNNSNKLKNTTEIIQDDYSESEELSEYENTDTDSETDSGSDIDSDSDMN